VEKCGGKIWWENVVEKDGIKRWWKKMVEKSGGNSRKL
jgi:hypothetical protein